MMNHENVSFALNNTQLVLSFNVNVFVLHVHLLERVSQICFRLAILKVVQIIFAKNLVAFHLLT